MIASLQYVSDLLKREDLKPNRNLGQNFFINGELLFRLIADVYLSGKTVLEIGPGLGALTELMLQRGASVIAVEKDPNMVKLLKGALNCDSLQVVEGDILRFKGEELPRPFTAAGNLPYFITADIIEILYRWRPEQMLLMLQKEAADRFFAKPSDKNYMPLGIACSLFYSCKKLGDIAPDNYLPSPSVTSTMVLLKEREDAPNEDPQDILSFFNECFHMRRKTLVNNLSAYAGVRDALNELKFKDSIRAEALSPEDLLNLYRILKRKA